MDSTINNKFIKQEERFLGWIEIDYVPLYDVVRLFSGYSKMLPTEKEFLKAIKFLDYLLKKYGSKLKYYLGPGAEQINQSPEEFLTWLKKIWYSGEYKDKRHDFWFDLD